MKNLLLFTITFFLLNTKIGLCQNENIQFPTFAGLPGPENVLVVYNPSSNVSRNIMIHYDSVRNVPDDNIFPLTLLSPPSGVEFDHELEIVKGPGLACWTYVKETLADPIEQWLNTHYYNGELLRDVVRYILLCKDIPLKIQPTDQGVNENNLLRDFVSVDALLCLINQEPNKHFM